MSGTATYAAWQSMINRCVRPSAKHYEYYGGRGIKVCDRWRHSFHAFFEDMGEKPDGFSLGRIDNDGNYEPGNCRWEAFSDQQNNKRSNRFVTFQGRTLTVAQWAQETGLSRYTISGRLDRGWPVDEALTRASGQ